MGGVIERNCVPVVTSGFHFPNIWLLYSNEYVCRTKRRTALCSSSQASAKNITSARKHSSRMRTSQATCPPYVLWRPPNVSTGRGITSEQVWTDFQWWQPDVTCGGGCGWLGGRSCPVRSHVWGQGQERACKLRSNRSWKIITRDPSVVRQKRLKTLL